MQRADQNVASGNSRADVVALRAELARKIAAHIHVEGPIDTDLAGLRLSRRTAPSEFFCTTYEPELVVFVQGEKRITVGGTTHLCDGSSFLLTSVDLPGRARSSRPPRANRTWRWFSSWRCRWYARF